MAILLQLPIDNTPQTQAHPEKLNIIKYKIVRIPFQKIFLILSYKYQQLLIPYSKMSEYQEFKKRILVS